ncbi:hypothetical protein BI334_12795 [Moorena producens 3L]|nr:hypothetical protein BI334_12795 [Moorena producens 3L]
MILPGGKAPQKVNPLTQSYVLRHHRNKFPRNARRLQRTPLRNLRITQCIEAMHRVDDSLAGALQNVLNRVFFWRGFLRIITRSYILRVIFGIWAKFGIHLGHLLLVVNNIIIKIIKYLVKGFYDFFWGKVF